MSIAKILVPVSGTDSDGIALATAMVAAAPFAAHVQALFVPPDPRLSIPYAGAPISPTVIDSIMTALERVNKESSLRARQLLADAAKLEGATICPTPQRLDRVTCSFKEDMGFFALRTGRYARVSDLVVFASLPDDIFSEANEAFVETLIRAARPVLITPTVPQSLTAKISVAWDGSAACAHAMTSALPFLTRAGKVELLEIEPLHGNGIPVTEAKEYLDLHRVPTALRFIKRDKHTTAETLLHEAASGGASMLVMGGYGHNRFSEAVFGGVSSFIKWHATLPVFMSH
jgi:nucleotide-binding universal stress UspA family protein